MLNVLGIMVVVVGRPYCSRTRRMLIYANTFLC